jgi:hypothetical protein
VPHVQPWLPSLAQLATTRVSQSLSAVADGNRSDRYRIDAIELSA